MYSHAASCEHLQHSKSIEHRTLWEWACLAQKRSSLGAKITEHNDTASESGRGLLSQELPISRTTPNLKQPSVIHAARDARRKILTKKQSEMKADLQCRIDHCIMRLICMCSLVPNAIDSSEWKELLTTLNPDIHPVMIMFYRALMAVYSDTIITNTRRPHRLRCTSRYR